MDYTKHGLAIFLVGLLLMSCQGDPQVQRDEFYQSAQRHLQEDSYPEAEIQFRNTLKLDDTFLPAHLGLAKMYQKLSAHQNAISEFQRVLELDSSNREAKLEMGKYFLLSGQQGDENYSEARKLAEELLDSDPSDFEARILLGNAYAGLNDLERSVDEMKMVLEQDPSNLGAQLNLGSLQMGLHDTPKAEETFLEALGKHPESVAVHGALGNFYTFTRDFKKAEHHFNQALELGKENSTALYSLVRFHLITERPEKAEEVLKEAIQAHPDWREPKWGLANFYIAKKERAEGLELFHDLLEDDPKDRVTRIQLAELYLSQDEDEKAEDLVSSLLQANQNDAEAHHLRGMLLLTKNDPDGALIEFNRAIQLKGGLIPAYLQKASLHLARQEYTQAQEALNEVLRWDRNHIGAKAGVAKIMVLTGRPEEALQRARAILEVQPNHVDALFAEGEASLRLGRLDQAEAVFQKLDALEPRTPSHLYRLGSISALKGDDSRALAYYKEVLKIDPDLVDVMSSVVGLHVKAEHFVDAIAEVNRFMKNSSLQDALHFLRGTVWMAQEHYAQAEQDFRKAIEINTTNYAAYLALAQLHRDQNNLKQAIKEVDQLLGQDDRFAPAHVLKASYLEVENDIPGAIDHYKRALVLDPENTVAANNLAWIYCENDQNLAEALSLAQRALKNHPGPLYADTLGWIYYKMGNYSLAVDQLLASVNNTQEPDAQNYYHLAACRTFKVTGKRHH